MRVYLKSGRSFRISQKVANELAVMIIDKDKKGDNLLIQRFRFHPAPDYHDKNLTLLIKTDEIEAIK